MVDEEKEGIYDPTLHYSKEEMDRWQLDSSVLEEKDWGSRNEDLEVVSRVGPILLDASRFFRSSSLLRS